MYTTTLTPSATASGTTTRRCSRTTRCVSVSLRRSSATGSPGPHVDTSDHRDQQPLLVGFLRWRDDVTEAACLLERLDEGIEILGPACLNGDVDDELSLRAQRRVYRGNPHIVRQRVFELIEEVGPRERPLIDDAVGLAGSVGNHFQFFGVDLRPNRRGLASQPRRFALGLDGMGAERPLALGQSNQFERIERAYREYQEGERTENELHDAFVVERTGGEIGLQHQAVTVSRRVRNAMPTSGPRTSIRSGVAEIRSVSAAVRDGSIASTDTPRRSSRFLRAESTAPPTRPLPPRNTRANRCP